MFIPNFIKWTAIYYHFSPKAFDMIVSRNVTWTLYDPIHAFKQWHHVLKPGGKTCDF